MVEVLSCEPSFTPDVYFTEGYGRLDAHSIGGSWITLAEADGSWQMPVVLVERGGGHSEAIGPYGYAGIRIDGGLSAREAALRWDRARELLSELGVASLFLRFSPLDLTSQSISTNFSELTVRRSGTTYLVKIAEPGVMWDAMEGRARTSIRKARQHGYTGSVRPAEESDITSGSDFRRLYEDTMRRVGAADRYLFDDRYYRDLRTSLGPDLLMTEIRDGEIVVAAALVMRHGTNGHYHLSGSEPSAARLGANAVLLWTILEWCSEAGVEHCHLGGGLAEGDGLAKFKRSFGGEAMDFFTGRSIINREAYLHLTASRANSIGTTVDSLIAAEYFPAFRASVSAVE